MTKTEFKTRAAAVLYLFKRGWFEQRVKGSLVYANPESPGQGRVIVRIKPGLWRIIT
jgi:predicted RNA binding protein YcfA (HicA-like mRNA interferase family)